MDKIKRKMIVPFDEGDRVLLDQMCNFADALGNLLGDLCEIVVHSLEKCEVIKIINGNISDRKIGSPMVDEAHNAYKKYLEDPNKPFSVYFMNQNLMKNFRSLTYNIKNNGKLIGFFSINMDTSLPLSTLAQLIVPPDNGNKQRPLFKEIKNEDEDEERVIIRMIRKIKEDTSIPVGKKVFETVRQLNDIGFFEIKKGVFQLSEALGISEQTIYKHLRNITKEGG